MEYLVGMVLSLATAGVATAAGFDRERAFYPTVLVVIASYSVLFTADGLRSWPQCVYWMT